MTNFDQVQDFSCPICFSVFSVRDNIPYTLRCGHTHCHKCLNNLIFNNASSCGKCRKEVPHDFENQLPINYTLLGAIESLQNSSKEEEMVEFKEIELKVNETLARLGETKTKYNLQIDDLKRKIDEIDKESDDLITAKQNLKRARQCLLSNSIKKSMETMGEAMSDITELHKRSDSVISKLHIDEQMEHFQSFYDSPDDHYISSEKSNKITTYFVSENLMYIKSFSHQSQSRKSEIKIHTLRPLIKNAYIKFGYGQCFSVVEFEFFDKNGTRAKHFINRCLGEEKSFMNANIYNHDRIGKEGHSLCIGIEGDNSSASAINKGCTKVDYIKGGYITAVENAKKVNHFKIFIESWHSKSCYPCIGKITKGLFSIKTALRSNLDLRILECGVVADLSNAE